MLKYIGYLSCLRKKSFPFPLSSYSIRLGRGIVALSAVLTSISGQNRICSYFEGDLGAPC
jgi:hypothetical protein